MGSLHDRRVLDRTERAFRRSDAGLSALFDSFTARTVGHAMPRAERPGSPR